MFPYTAWGRTEHTVLRTTNTWDSWASGLASKDTEAVANQTKKILNKQKCSLLSRFMSRWFHCNMKGKHETYTYIKVLLRWDNPLFAQRLNPKGWKVIFEQRKEKKTGAPVQSWRPCHIRTAGLLTDTRALFVTLLIKLLTDTRVLFVTLLIKLLTDTQVLFVTWLIKLLTYRPVLFIKLMMKLLTYTRVLLNRLMIKLLKYLNV